MKTTNNSKYLPDQRTTRKAKLAESFYTSTAEYCLGITGVINKDNVKSAYNTVNNIIDEEDYKKILNPYNTSDPKYKRFPATLRNYDMTADIVRRYMGEFLKQNFQYTIHSVDADVAVRFNNKLLKEIVNKATKVYVSIVNNGINKGDQAPEIPDFKEFFDDFKENYVDEYAIEGNKALKAITEYTNSVELYYGAFYNYIVTGFPISYRDIRNGNLFKEIISPLDFDSVGTSRYIRDHDICKRVFKLSPNDLLNNFSDILDENLTNSLREIFRTGYTNSSNSPTYVPMQYFTSVFTGETLSTLHSASSASSGVDIGCGDNMLIGTHLTFKTEVPIFYVQRLNPESGIPYETMIEEDSYTLNPQTYDISVTKDWINEIWEMYCFGNYGARLYSKPRPIAYQHRPSNNIKECSQPYNGIYELIYGSNYVFSLPTIIKPFQVLRNILFYAREKTIAKNKDVILLMPKSLLGNNDEDTIYRMESSGVLPYDDSNDDTTMKANNIRAVSLSLDRYINVITEIIASLKSEAWDLVDMNPQRYGDINTSAGKGTTQEAIVRSSMGSVLIYTMFDKFLEQDYQLDLDYSKVTLSDQSMLNVMDTNNNMETVAFDSSKHILADYKLSVRNSTIDQDKRNKLDSILFNMSQNGEGQIAAEAVYEDSIAGLRQLIKKGTAATKQFQQEMQEQKNQALIQVEQSRAATEKAKLDSEKEIALIKEDGENERASLELQLKYIDTISALEERASANNDLMNSANGVLDNIKELNNVKMHNDKMQLERDKMKSAEKIAKMNKN